MGRKTRFAPGLSPVRRCVAARPDNSTVRISRRFARAGYLALAPELFVRQGDPQSYGEMARLIAEVVSQVADAQVARDLDACLVWAGAHGGDLSKAAVTGFCWGGRQTWLYAAHSPRLKAAVAWYGRLEGERTPLQPQHPLDRAGELKAPVLGLYGGADTGIPLASVERMQAALAQGSPRRGPPPSWSIPMRRTPSTPTTAPATARQPPRMAGSAASIGLRDTASYDARMPKLAVLSGRAGRRRRLCAVPGLWRIRGRAAHGV